MFNIKKIIEDNTKDDVIDYAKINESLKSQVDGIVKKNQPNLEETKAQFQKDFMKELGYNDIHTLKEKLANNFTVTESKYNELQGKYNELESLNEELKTFKTKATNLERTALIKDKGYTDKYQIAGILQELNSKVNEENRFEDLLGTIESINNPTLSTGTPSGNKTGAVSDKLGWESKLEEKYGIKL